MKCFETIGHGGRALVKRNIGLLSLAVASLGLCLASADTAFAQYKPSYTPAIKPGGGWSRSDVGTWNYQPYRPPTSSYSTPSPSSSYYPSPAWPTYRPSPLTNPLIPFPQNSSPPLMNPQQPGQPSNSPPRLVSYG